MVTIGSSQVAIIYGSSSRILRAKIVPAPGEVVHVTPPSGQSVLVMARAQLYHDAAARQAIATATGHAPLGADDDRCGVVDGTSTVVSIIKADPALDSVAGGSLRPHPLVEIGDTWSGAGFQRRWVFVEAITGRVVSATMVPLGSVPTPPVGQTAVASNAAVVGATIPSLA